MVIVVRHLLLRCVGRQYNIPYLKQVFTVFLWYIIVLSDWVINKKRALLFQSVATNINSTPPPRQVSKFRLFDTVQ